MKNNIIIFILTTSGALGACTQLFYENHQNFFAAFSVIFFVSFIFILNEKTFLVRLKLLFMIAGFFFLGAVVGRLLAQ